MLAPHEIWMVAPALEKYRQDRLLGDVWKRPGLTPRDRSVVTIAALITRNQTSELPYYLEVALDQGVKPREISQIITHLAFYSGWGNAMSAVAVAKDVFARRQIAVDQVPQPSPPLLPLNEAAEAERAARVSQQFGNVAPGVVQYTTDVLFRDLWLRPDLAPRDRSLVTVSALISSGHVAQNPVPPQQGDGRRPHASSGRGGHHALGLLCRLAHRVLGAAGREGSFRQASEMRGDGRETADGSLDARRAHGHIEASGVGKDVTFVAETDGMTSTIGSTPLPRQVQPPRRMLRRSDGSSDGASRDDQAGTALESLVVRLTTGARLMDVIAWPRTSNQHATWSTGL